MTTTSLHSKNRLPLESELLGVTDGVTQSLPLAYARSPLLPVVVCFILGILLNSFFSIRWVIWISLVVTSIIGWSFCYLNKKYRSSAILLLVSFFFIGGMRHHLFWSISSENNIRQLLSLESQLIKIQGCIIAEPVIQKEQHEPFRSAWQRYDRSRLVIDCHQISTNSGWKPVTGRLRLSVDGHLLSVHVGQQIESTGWASLARGPMNPGQFDFRERMKRQSVDGLLYVNHPDAVLIQGETSQSYIVRWFSRLRREININFVQQLSPENVPLAEALLLGSRTSLNQETRDAFSQSGMMHVLAISGLHIGLLAMMIWGMCRLLKLSYSTTALIVFSVVMFCAILVEARPPIMRATIFISIALIGKICLKRIRTGNLIALTVLIMLAWNPSDLFDVGAQLSFLAVMGIFFYGQISRTGETSDSLMLEERHTDFASKLRRIGLQGYLFFRQSFLMIGCIWLFSIPLVMSQFHLISPIGFVLNIILLPVVVLTLWLGYFFLFAGILLPWLMPVVGSGFDSGLTLLSSSVQWGASQHFGHQHVAGPSDWWLYGYYLLLLSVILLWWRVRKRLWLWSILGSWVVLGLSLGLTFSHSDQLRCTFLSVGHGCAIFVELPNGKTLLYDAGSIQDSRRAEQAVENLFWEHGYRKLNAIVISHADIDHFNGVPGLLNKVPVESLLVARSFLKFDQASVEHLSESARLKNVPIQLLSSNDRILLDESVSITVLHPPAKWNSQDDNAGSIALKITYAGKTILLLGDLEKEGMNQLLEGPQIKTSALLAPHHGSLIANSVELATWASPEHVIVSGGHQVPLHILQERYGKNCTLYSTSQTGAVTISITKNGQVKATTFRENEE